MKCKKCGNESNTIIESGKYKDIKWKDLGYCMKCFKKFRKERGIKSLKEINDELKKEVLK